MRKMRMNEKFIKIPVPNKNKPFSITLAGITYPHKGYHINRKKSNTMCIEYVISGGGIVRCNSKEYHVSTGDTYLLLPGEDHEYFSDETTPFKKIWFNAQGPMINILVNLYNLKGITVFKNTDTQIFFEKIHNILQDKVLSLPEIQDKYTLVFHKMLQFLCTSILPQKKTSAHKLKDYIDMNVFEDINIKKLSQLIYKSESQTIRIFKEEFGTTPYNYLLESKINYAKNMLRNSAVSIKEISNRLCFSDEYYFSNIFKQKTGMSPKSFRNSI